MKEWRGRTIGIGFRESTTKHVMGDVILAKHSDVLQPCMNPRSMCLVVGALRMLGKRCYLHVDHGV